MTPFRSKRTPGISLELAVERRNKNSHGITNKREVASIARMCGVGNESVRQFLASSGYELTKTIGGVDIWKREKQKQHSLSGRCTRIYKAEQSK